MLINKKESFVLYRTKDSFRYKWGAIFKGGINIFKSNI